MAKKRLQLPAGIKINRDFGDPDFENGDEIQGYCMDCVRKGKCRDNRTLREAMGENFPFWSERFVAVVAETAYKSFDKTTEKVFCRSYKSPQQKLPGMARNFSDGVTRLLEILEKEKTEYLSHSSER